jgi:redox-sensitive bicupin YhaK (pirin superfamily)
MTAIELVIDPRERRVGTGTVRRLLPDSRHRMVGPFIFLDRPGTDEPGPGGRIDIAAHPHIGLSTLTYLFEGEIVHRDSIGCVQTITPGAVNWMTAGSGVTHTERSPADHDPATPAFNGLQMWVALPADAEDGDPFFDHRPASAIPTDEHGDVRVRVAAGTAFGMTSPVPVSSPLVLAEIDLGDHGALTLDRAMPERAVLPLDGNLTIGGDEAKQGSLAVLDSDQAPRLEGTGRAILLGGEPVGTRHIWWNFVHRDPDVIEDAKHRWRDQLFPKVPRDHDGWVPLPG